MKESKQKLLQITGLSNEVFELLRFELNMFLVRLGCYLNPFKIYTIKKYINQTDIRLNIGAGPFGELGWVNIDMFKFKQVSFTYDCRKKLPFKSETITKIRCEHVLEHMDRDYEALLFLKACNRVLVSGGIIRIVVPDISKYVEAYYENDWAKVGLDNNQIKSWQGAAILTHTFRQDGEHKYGYDFEALSKLLQDAGFQTISKSQFGVSMDPDLKSDQPNHQPYSLYVEAVK